MRRGGRYVLLALAVLIALFPFWWMLVTSLKRPVDIFAGVSLVPQHVTTANYSRLFDAYHMGSFLVNSLIVVTVSVAASLVIGTLAAYALARFTLPLNLNGSALVIAMLVRSLPAILLVIPLYITLAKNGLLNTRLGLILVYCTFAIPFVLWTMGNYFKTIPLDLEDAARIDGYSRLGAMFKVVLPLARPGLLATTLFVFLIAWDEFLYALIFTSTPAAKTIPVAIAEFTGRYTTDFGLQAAGGILAALPPVLIAFCFQRYIVGGLATGAVKG